MSKTEFEIIDSLIKQRVKLAPDIFIGIGDDAAEFSVPSGRHIVTTIDTMVSGTHFLPGDDPQGLGYKSLAVSLSDLAAMGAYPHTALISLTLPVADEQWITRFYDGFFTLADQFKVTLVGGDITQGPLSVSVVANGLVRSRQAIRRSGATVGDSIYVTGNLGDAGFALQQKLQKNVNCNDYLQNRLSYPTPRVDMGLKLSTLASAAIDISDGLIADLEKMMHQSACGAEIQLSQLPLSPALLDATELAQAQQLALSAGEDFEICFSANPHNHKQLMTISEKLACPITRIGTVTTGSEIKVLDQHNHCVTITQRGYEHFQKN